MASKSTGDWAESSPAMQYNLRVHRALGSFASTTKMEKIRKVCSLRSSGEQKKNYFSANISCEIFGTCLYQEIIIYVEFK